MKSTGALRVALVALVIVVGFTSCRHIDETFEDFDPKALVGGFYCRPSPHDAGPEAP